MDTERKPYNVRLCCTLSTGRTKYLNVSFKDFETYDIISGLGYDAYLETFNDKMPGKGYIETVECDSDLDANAKIDVVIKEQYSSSSPIRKRQRVKRSSKFSNILTKKVQRRNSELKGRNEAPQVEPLVDTKGV